MTSVPSWLIRFLRARGEIHVVAGPTAGSLRVGVRGGRVVGFRVQAESRLSGEKAAGYAARFSTGITTRGRVLLATNRLTEHARLALRKNGISWVERDTGVCYLHAQGLLIDLRRPPDGGETVAPATGIERPTRLRGRSGVVVETLLLHWARHRGPVALSDIAAGSGVSAQLASRVLRRLTADGLLRAEGTKPRRRWSVEDAPAILDRWADEERPAEQATGLYVWAPSPRELHAKLVKLSASGLRWALGGVSAANRYAPSLTAEPVPEVWIPADVPAAQVAEVLGGELVESGASLRVLQTAGDPALRHAAPRLAGPDRDPPFGAGEATLLVSAPRAFVEARAAAGRGPDVAANVRRLFLASTDSTAQGPN